MKKLSRVILFCLIATVSTGCATQKSWVYKANQYSYPTAKTKKTAVVLPFKDQRNNENVNHIALYLIPLAIYGSANFNAPEGSQMHINSGLWTNYKPTEDYAKALAEELQGTGFFKEAYFDFKTGNADYIIQGTIINTDYKGKLFSYGLSVYGPLLWFIGFPATTVENQLVVEISCTDAATRKVLLSRKYTATPVSRVSWIYKLNNDFNYPEMLKSTNRKFCDDLHPVILQ